MTTPLHPERFRFRAAARADRAASRRRAQRLAPARWPRRRRRVDRIFRDLPDAAARRRPAGRSTTRAWSRRACSATRRAAAQVEVLVERVLTGARGASRRCSASKKPPAGTRSRIAGGFDADVLGRWPARDGALFRLRFTGDPLRTDRAPRPRAAAALHQHARRRRRRERYQTVFAREPGAVAAPTAALHFDAARCSPRCDARGVERASVTLHVGAGTFQPVRSREPRRAHACTASGTTVPRRRGDADRAPRRRAAAAWSRSARPAVRALEVGVARRGELQAGSGDTEHLHHARASRSASVDRLITNFHLPEVHAADAGVARSPATSASATRTRTRSTQRYRFFSYGDAMLLAPRRDDPHARISNCSRPTAWRAAAA